MLMNNGVPQIIGENHFQITVNAETLKETFNQEKTAISDFLSKKLDSSNFQLSIVVDSKQDDNQPKIITNPKEKYDYMVEINPELKKLRDELDLDFEY